MNTPTDNSEAPKHLAIPSEFRLILMPFCSEDAMVNQLVAWNIPRTAISTESGLRFHSKPDVNLVEEHKGSFFFSEAGMKLLKEVREGNLQLAEKQETEATDVGRSRKEILSFVEKVQRNA